MSGKNEISELLGKKALGRVLGGVTRIFKMKRAGETDKNLEGFPGKMSRQ